MGGGEWVWQLLAQIVLAVVAVIVMDEFPWLSCCWQSIRYRYKPGSQAKKNMELFSWGRRVLGACLRQFSS